MSWRCCLPWQESAKYADYASSFCNGGNLSLRKFHRLHPLTACDLVVFDDQSVDAQQAVLYLSAFMPRLQRMSFAQLHAAMNAASVFAPSPCVNVFAGRGVLVLDGGLGATSFDGSWMVHARCVLFVNSTHTMVPTFQMFAPRASRIPFGIALLAQCTLLVYMQYAMAAHIPRIAPVLSS